MKRKVITTQQIDDMIIHYRSGKSIAETAELVGSSVPTVRKYLLKSGVRLRKPGRPTFKTLNRLSKNIPKLPEQVEETVEVEEITETTTEDTTTTLPPPQRVFKW